MTWPTSIIGWLTLAMVLAGGIAIIGGSFISAVRRGRGEILRLAEDERDVWRDRASRFEQDLTLARVKCAEDIGVLTGKVERLEVENQQQAERLAKLSPEVLIAAMGETAKANREFYAEALHDALHPLEQSLDRLLTKGDEG